MLGDGFVFLGPGHRVFGQTQQERQSGRHEELQPGQHVEDGLPAHTGRDLQHQAADAPEPHTVRDVVPGQESAVRGVPVDGVRVVSGSVAEPFRRRTAGNGHSARASRRFAGARVRTQQGAHTQVSRVL